MEYPGGNYRGNGTYLAVATVPEALKTQPPLEDAKLIPPAATHNHTPQPDVQPPHQQAERRGHHEARRSPVKRRIVGGLVAAVMAVLPGHTTKEVVEPDVEAVEMVNQLLEEPDIPYAADPSKKDTGYRTGDLDAEYARNVQIFARRDAIAKKNGLDVYDGSQLIRSLQQMRNGFHTLEAHDAYIQFSAFLAQYGVRVQLDHTDIPPGSNLQDVPEAYLSTSAARATLVQLVRDFAATPKQYIELAGIKRLVLAMPPDSGTNQAGYTEGEFNKGDYIVSNVDANGQQLLAHELAHRINGRITPSTDNFNHNPSFANAAGNPPYGAPTKAGGTRPDNVPANNNGYITLNQFNYLYKSKRAEIMAKADKDNCANAAHSAAELLTAQAARVDFNSTYAAASEPEQQAEIDAPIANGDRSTDEIETFSTYDFHTVTSPYFPRLREQFVHELARLASANSVGRRIVTYFMQIAFKHQAANPATEIYQICDKP